MTSRKMDRFTESSRENTSNFLLSVSLGHEEGLRSLESEIKMRIALTKNKRKTTREAKEKIEAVQVDQWRQNMTISRSRKMLDLYVNEKQQRGNYTTLSIHHHVFDSIIYRRAQ